MADEEQKPVTPPPEPKPAPKISDDRAKRFEFDGYDIQPPDDEAQKKYNPSQPREDDGKFGEGGGSGSSKPEKKPRKPKPTEDKKPSDKPADEPAPAQEEDTRNYRDFGTLPESTVAMGFQREAPKPSATQHAAMEYYRDNEGNAVLNRGLRKGGELAPETQQHVAELDSVLDSSKLEHDTTLYRGMAGTNPQTKIFEEQIRTGQLKPGSVLSDKGYASTTLSGSIAQDKFAEGGGVVFKIKAPKGSNGLYMNSASDKFVGGRYDGEFRDEMEVLLPRNSQYKVNKITQNGNQYEVEMAYEGVQAGAGKSAVKADAVLDLPAIKTYFYGGSIAVIKAEGDSARVGGYLVAFGNPEDRDAHGEYFTEDTDLSLDWYGELPVLYHHGLDKSVSSTRIGTITSLVKDKVGIWAEAILDLTIPFARSVLRMVERGILGWSSGSAPHLVAVTTDGEIRKWPIVEGSLTPTPAETRGRTTAEAIRSAIKTLEETTSALEDVTPDALGEPPQVARVGQQDARLFNALKASLKTYEGKFKMGMMEVYEKAGLSPEQIVALMKAMEEAGGAMEAPAEPDGDEAVMADDTAPADEPTAPPPEDAYMSKAKEAAKGATGKEIAAIVEKAMKAAQRTAPATIKLPGTQKDMPTATKAHDVTVYSKTQALTAPELAYLIEARTMLGAKTGRPYTPPIEMVRELAEKTQKAIKSGELDIGKGENGDKDYNNKVLAIKSNELDNTQVAAAAGNWVPELWSSQLWLRVRVPTRVAGQFQVTEMPSATYDLPVEDTDPDVFFVPETTDNAQLDLAQNVPIPSSVVQAGKVQLVSKKLASRTGFSSEMMEDSIIQFIPQLRNQAVIAIENAIESVLINGDTTNSASNINGTPTNGFARFLALNGMRYLGLVTNAASLTNGPVNALGATPTLQMVRQARFRLISSLNNYALDPSNIVIIVDPYTYGRMLNIDELLAWYNNGRDSTVNTGVLPNIDGSVVIPSPQIPLTDATGVVSGTAANNIFGTMIIAAKGAWKVGYRRNVTSSLDYLPYYESYQLTNTVRIAFKNKDNIANAVIYGLATT